MSVVIPTHERRVSVERELHALATQSVGGSEFEVIVSIDGSEDGTREMVESFDAPFSLTPLWHPRRGRAAACNSGAAWARGELLLFLDDDMEPEPQCLAAHLEAHSEDARRGVVGAVPIALDASTPPVVQYVGRKFNSHLEKLARPGSEIGIRGFYSGNFSIRRDLFLELGGYDEDFRSYGNEDGDLATRLAGAGVTLVFSSKARAKQNYEKDFAGLAWDNIAKGTTAVLSVRKNPDTLGQVRLGTYARASLKWRLARGGLLAWSRVFPGTPARVVRLVERLERWRPTRLHAYYELALDYFFWFGASSALARKETLRDLVFSPGPRERTRHGPNGHPVHR